MNWNDLLNAVALLLILEGILPFASPRSIKNVYKAMQDMPERSLRMVGFGKNTFEMNTWLLPDGINESLPNEAHKLESLRRHLIDLYATWGYRLVMPPLVEYMESLRAGMGTQLDLQTFKITDQLNGRLMGVRADITPQVARIDAHRLSKGETEASVNRLCYMGTVLRTRSDEQGGSRSPVQVGAELFGHAGMESDFEIISLMLETFHSIEINDLILDLGHVGIASGLAEHVGLNQQQKDDYFDMLARKSIPEVSSWLDQQGFSSSDSAMLSALPLLSGSLEVIKEAKSQLKNAGQKVLGALDHLESISELIATYFPDLQLHIDLAEMRGYSYHTGIMYTLYSHDRGKSIASGGRYNGIGEAFGNARPAIGFSTDLRTLANLSSITETSVDANGILAPNTMDVSLDKFIRELRTQGEYVIRQLDQNTKITVEQLQLQDCNRVIEKQGESWNKIVMGKNVVVLGTQWGDEGKGKVVDLLTEDAACCCTFSGWS
ncbi:ATP phosphoribosyltransferase regulatory subunit [Nymphon striatum]|nr:ATP phosphoribosyltransferase regulatory subunit [Nymphon striatum]